MLLLEKRDDKGDWENVDIYLHRDSRADKKSEGLTKIVSYYNLEPIPKKPLAT